MTSKNSFFKLAKEDIRHRLYLPAMSCLAFFFMYPVGVLLLISSTKVNFFFNSLSALSYDEQLNRAILENFKMMYQEAQIDSFLLILMGLVAALSGFAYLMKANRSDLYHGLPFKRETLYLVSVANGFLMTYVPAFVFSLVGGLVASVRISSMVPMTIMLTETLYNIPKFLICYASAVLVVMLTGQMMTAIVGTVAVFSYFPALATLVYLIHTVYFHTYYGDVFEKVYTPYIMISPVAVAFSIKEKPLMYIAICLVVGAAFLALALYLYKIRPLEAAGKALVFEKTKFPIKLMIVVPCAMAGALFMKTILASRLWGFFGFACAFIVVHCIMEIVYNSDFRSLFSHMGQFAICFAVGLALFLTVSFDLVGYDKYMPREDEIESVGLICYDLEGNLYNLNQKYELEHNDIYDEYYVNDTSVVDNTEIMDSMTITDKATVLDIASKGIDYTLEKAKEEQSILSEMLEDSTEDYELTTSVDLSYRLKNGRYVRRSYSMLWEDVKKSMELIHDNPEFKKGTYPLLTMDEQELSGVNYEDMLGKHHVNADAATLTQLMRTYKEEFSALTFEKRRHETPVLCLQFKSSDFQKMADIMKEQEDYYDYLNDIYYYPVYPSFTRTLEILRQNGVVDCGLITENDVDHIMLTYNRYDEETEDYSTEEYDVTDKAQIREILDAAVYPMTYLNSARPSFYGIDCEMNFTADFVQKANSGSEKAYGSSSKTDCMINLSGDAVPRFVMDQFHLTRSDVEDNVGITY